MFLFLISCFSFILVSNSLCWRRKHSPWIREAFSSFMVSWFQKGSYGIINLNQHPNMKIMSLMNKNNEKDMMTSLMDLPELTLDCILERLPPSGLCSMAGVCSYLRDKCVNDHFWEKHLKQKWGKLIGEAAYREWQWHVHVASSPSSSSRNQKQNRNGFLGFLTNNYKWLFSWFRPNMEKSSRSTSKTDLPVVDSIMSLYLSLETGKFWFPAQVYNREVICPALPTPHTGQVYLQYRIDPVLDGNQFHTSHLGYFRVLVFQRSGLFTIQWNRSLDIPNGHAGFMLSCYDAKLSYDSKTDTFEAVYGRQTSEDNISWDRIRVPPIDTASDVLYISDCLHDLKPGDHIEIQWRRSIEFPYGWWYGVVGHLESCDTNQTHCQCKDSELVMLEFNQYRASSRWRRTMIKRKEHREIGNEDEGFYGGIRKLYKDEDISTWKRLCPNQIVQ